MNIALTIISLLMGVSCFFVEREQKLLILLVTILCFNAIPCQVEFIRSPLYCVTMFFLLSESKTLFSTYRADKSNIIWVLILIILIGAILNLYRSPNYNTSTVLIAAYFRDNLISSYLILLYAFCTFDPDKSAIKICMISKRILYILTFFGIVNYALGHPIFLETFGGNSENVMHMIERSTLSSTGRFRVCSMFANSFDYGFASLILLAYHFYCYFKGALSKREIIISTICALFGILVCGSRTLLICTLATFFAFVAMGFRTSNSIKYTLLVGCIFILASSLFPQLSIITDKVLSVFGLVDVGEGSSSLSMREVQWAAVLRYTSSDMIFGNGYGYFLKDLGYAEGVVDNQLQGLEGIYMSLLLERGIFGMVIYYLFWGISLLYFLRMRKTDLLTSGFAVSIITCYLVFAHATGQLSSLPITLLLLGICYKIISENRYYEATRNNNSSL